MPKQTKNTTLTKKSKEMMEKRKKSILESDTEEEIDGVEIIHETIESDAEMEPSIKPEKKRYFRKDYKGKDKVMEWT